MYFYGNHNPYSDARLLMTKPKYLVDNPPHGLYGEMQGYDCAWLLHDIKTFQDNEIKVFGYITGGYEGRYSSGSINSSWFSLENNLNMISKMAEVDGVDGIFIDECSAYPDGSSREYLKCITDLSHSYNILVWGNVGVDQFSEWYFIHGGFDLMQSTEDWRGQTLSQVQRDWGHRITVSGNNHLYTVKKAVELTLDALEKGLAYCYITNTQYISIAPWIEEYVYLLRCYDNQSQLYV